MDALDVLGDAFGRARSDATGAVDGLTADDLVAACGGLADHEAPVGVADEQDRPVAEIADEKGVTPAQVALAWLLHQPVVTAPIIGASRLEHLDQAADAVDVELTADELEHLGGAAPARGSGRREGR